MTAPGPQVTDKELQAAFMAARAHGAILQDDVLRAIILAARAMAEYSATVRPAIDRALAAPVIRDCDPAAGTCYCGTD